MSESAPTAAVRFKVTYLNQLDGNRYDLVDDIDSETADRVIERFGNKNDRLSYLAGLVKEKMS